MNEVPAEAVNEAVKELENVVKIDDKRADVAKKAVKVAKKALAKVKEARKAVAKGEASRRQKQKVTKVRKQDKARQKKARADRPKKPKGPAYAEFKNKFRAEIVQGQCRFKGCTTKPASKRAVTCQTHKKEYRKVQLALNNVKWRKRVEQGEAGHHVIYNRRVTEWALQNPVAARRIVSEGHSIADKELFEKALAKRQTEEKARKAKEKAKAA